MSGAAATDAGAGLYGPEHADFRESFRTFLEREVKPAYSDWSRERRIPADILRHAGEQGYLGMAVPEEHGGLGIDDPRFGAIVGTEAMLAGAPALALVLANHNEVALPALIEGAPDDWKRENLAGFASGERLAAVISDGIELAADGSLSGRAPMVPGAAAADAFVVVASPPEEGESALAVVFAGSGGVSVEPSDPPVGLDAAAFGTVRLEGAASVPLGPAADLEAVQAFVLGATALAGARAALEITRTYVTDRRAFGIPIADFQNTRRVLADIAAEIEVGDAFVERALRLRIDGSLDPRTAAVAKLFCTELLGRAVDAGLQLHGGYGYIMEYEIAHAFADARFWRLAGLTNQRARDAIGRALFE